MSAEVAPEALDRLSAALWEERRLLDELRFRLEEERLVALANHDRWLPAARAEVDAAVRQLRVAELMRAVRADDVAVAAGLAPAATLADLAAAVPEPWDFILGSHRTALVAAVAAVAADRCPTGAPAVEPPSLVEFLR